MKQRAVTVFLTLSLMAGCAVNPSNKNWPATAENPDFMHRAIKQVTDVVVHDIFSPPVAGRIYLYVCLAAYEASLPADSLLASLAGQLHDFEPAPRPVAGKQYSYTLAATKAVLDVGKNLVFSEDQIIDFETSLLNEIRATGMPKDVFERSLEYGTQVAAHVTAYADKDNYKQSRSYPKYTITDDPSSWKPTPPAYMDGIEPHWNTIKTVVLDSAAQFKPNPALPFSTDKRSAFYKEALETYELGNALKDEERDIALFWDCNPFVMNVKGHVMFATKKISPAGHWINITKVVCQQSSAGLTKSAEAYALTAIAMSEGFISCWDEKYRSKLIRPETYINQYIDENWVPILQTPPFPEYTSGHSVVSQAAAITLTSVFGENFSFTDSTEVEFGMPIRAYDSFKQAADEASISRLYGGIHYRRAIDEGVMVGKQVGNFVLSRLRTRRAEPSPELAVQ
jgi:hypothetical protein